MYINDTYYLKLMFIEDMKDKEASLLDMIFK